MTAMPTQRGFSLLELIGVMAVMAILAGTLAPSVSQMIDSAYEEAEETDLALLSDAWSRYVLENKRVPGAADTDWPAALADFAGLAESRILENRRGGVREVYFDPEFLLAGATSFNGLTQSQGLTARPHSPRLIIASRLDGALPASLGNASGFDAVWEQTAAASLVESSDVKLARVNLASDFHRVLISNSNTSQAGYSLETGVVGVVPAASGGADGTVAIHVIKGTRMNLMAAPYPTGALSRAFIVNGDTGARYETDGVSWGWVIE